MSRGATGELSSGAAVFGFDPEPRTPASRALHVLTLKRGLPRADLGARERFAEAALRAIGEAGLPVATVNTRRPTLDDVYLQLTGDRIADAA